MRANAPATRVTASAAAELARDLVQARAQHGELGAQRIESGGGGVQPGERGIGPRRRRDVVEREHLERLGLQRLQPSGRGGETLGDDVVIAGAGHGPKSGSGPGRLEAVERAAMPANGAHSATATSCLGDQYEHETKGECSRWAR